jgi:PAS domain S-box-containing protein
MNNKFKGLKESLKNQDYIKMLEDIIDTSYDGIYITDGKANTILINESYERITGLKSEDLIGRNMSEIVKSGIMSEATSFQVMENKEPVTVYQLFNTGKSAMVTSTPFFDEVGNITMIVSNVRDITELKDLKEKVKISKNENKKYKGIIEELKLQIPSTEYIVAEDENMFNLLLLAKRVAKVDSSVIIYGDTGSGKEVLAKYIYNNSMRNDKPYIKINCGAIPESLIESEFFGYTDGSFTGASRGGKTGIFEVSNGGTLFLDEVGELPLNMQVKLLRVLQDGEILKIGSSKPVKVDVRIIAATNRDLEKMVENGQFREDLYYRLNVVPLKLMPLRERKSSIIPMAEYFLRTYNEKYNLNVKISKDLYRYFYVYKWPGNVRELRNLIERLTITAMGDEVTIEDLPSRMIENIEIDVAGSSATKLEDALNIVEKSMIFRAFEKHGNVRDAAKELGIDPSTFVRKRKKYI